MVCGHGVTLGACVWKQMLDRMVQARRCLQDKCSISWSKDRHCLGCLLMPTPVVSTPDPFEHVGWDLPGWAVFLHFAVCAFWAGPPALQGILKLL